jgi:hypothetical protein
MSTTATGKSRRRGVAEALDASSTMVLPGMVGWRVRVKFAGQTDWFGGLATHFAGGKMYVLFDDGDKHTVSTAEGDKMKFKKQLTTGGFLDMSAEQGNAAFLPGSFGGGLAKTLRASNIDRSVALSAALRQCNIGLFIPDDDDGANGTGAHDTVVIGGGDDEPGDVGASGSKDDDDDDDDTDDTDDTDDDDDDDTDDDNDDDDDDDDSDDDDDDDDEEDTSDGSSKEGSSDSSDAAADEDDSDHDSDTSSASESSSESDSHSSESDEARTTVAVKWCNEATQVVRASTVPLSITFDEWLRLAEEYTGVIAASAVTR